MIKLVIFFLFIGIAVSFGVILTLRTYRVFKQKKKGRSINEELMKDVNNLKYIIIRQKDSASKYFCQNFTGVIVPEEIINNFLQCIPSTSYLEPISNYLERYPSAINRVLINSDILLISEYGNLQLIVILKEKVSRFFIYTLEDLMKKIIQKYGPRIDIDPHNLELVQRISQLVEEELPLYAIDEILEVLDPYKSLERCESCAQFIIRPYPGIDGEELKFCSKCFKILSDLIQEFEKEFNNN